MLTPVFSPVSAMPPISASTVSASSATIPLGAPASHLWAWVPGLALALAIGGGGFALNATPWLHNVSPAALAILLGILLRRALPSSAALGPGLHVATKTLLRAAVILLGLQVTLGQIIGLGLGTAGAVVAGLLVVSSPPTGSGGASASSRVSRA